MSILEWQVIVRSKSCEISCRITAPCGEEAIEKALAIFSRVHPRAKPVYGKAVWTGKGNYLAHRVVDIKPAPEKPVVELSF